MSVAELRFFSAVRRQIISGARPMCRWFSAIRRETDLIAQYLLFSAVRRQIISGARPMCRWFPAIRRETPHCSVLVVLCRSASNHLGCSSYVPLVLRDSTRNNLIVQYLWFSAGRRQIVSVLVIGSLRLRVNLPRCLYSTYRTWISCSMFVGRFKRWVQITPKL